MVINRFSGTGKPPSATLVHHEGHEEREGVETTGKKILP
jgi:hypothetical protein